MNSRKWLKGTGWAMAGMLMTGVAHGQTVAAAAPTAASVVSGDTAWVLVCTALVMLMTIPGLAFFYGGLVRR